MPMDLGMTRGEVGRHTEESERQILNGHVAKGMLQQTRDLMPGDEGNERQRIVAQRLTVDEGSAKTVGQLVDTPTQRNAGAEDRAHAGAADEVDWDIRLA